MSPQGGQRSRANPLRSAKEGLDGHLSYKLSGLIAWKGKGSLQCLTSKFNSLTFNMISKPFGLVKIIALCVLCPLSLNFDFNSLILITFTKIKYYFNHSPYLY